MNKKIINATPLNVDDGIIEVSEGKAICPTCGLVNTHYFFKEIGFSGGEYAVDSNLFNKDGENIAELLRNSKVLIKVGTCDICKAVVSIPAESSKEIRAFLLKIGYIG